LIGIVSTATVLLLLHVFEATLWALVYPSRRRPCT
jgi:hypothetical protein